MTADSTPIPTNQNTTSGNYDAADRAVGKAIDVTAEFAVEPAADSPEILRWRADILMDEMMLGAVDTAASGSANGHPVGTTPPADANLSHPDPLAPMSAPAAVETLSTQSAAQPAGAAGDPKRAQDDEEKVDEDWWRHPFRAPPAGREDDATIPPHSAALASSFGDDLASAQPAEAKSADIANVTGTGAAGAATGLLRPPSAVQPLAQGEVAAAPDPAAVVNGRHGASTESGRGRTRTNLLPRASEVNTEALWQEIDEMRAEIGSVIPENHEWSVRSRHLLDKAAMILRQSPDRTAEVEYYLNQVRGIRDSVRQSFQWSQIYVRQLNAYLLAWIGFAGVAALGCFIYRQELTNFFTLLTGLASDSFLMQALPLWFTTMALGALGGSLGARYTMHRHRRLEHGFFDRKYSLRGLLLPILAAFVGMILFVPFGLTAYFAPVSSAIAMTLVLIAMLLAFLYGLFQERLYGTEL